MSLTFLQLWRVLQDIQALMACPRVPWETGEGWGHRGGRGTEERRVSVIVLCCVTQSNSNFSSLTLSKK